ncbi:MAG TPA: hypothetical protein VN768_05535 [Acidimicrobiales bacterium]|nr:hypothetical protein [Acidimicrobiales bacterium]
MTDGHLTDEQLSSHLDDVAHVGDVSAAAAADAGEHLATCAQCGGRLAALEAVRDRMRTPVAPVDPEVRAASIAAVLRAAQEVAPARRTAPDVVAPSARRRPQVLVGAAAAVLVLAAAVGVPLALSSSGTLGGSAASAPVGPSRSPGSPGSSGSEKASNTHGPSNSVADAVGDLGTLDSVGALEARVDAVLSRDFAATPSGAAASAATPTTTTASGTPTTTAGPAGVAPTATPGPVPPTPPIPTGLFDRCLSSATAAAGAGRTLQLLATATFKGTSSLVYVFTATSARGATANAARSVVVVSAPNTNDNGCRLLASTPL